MSSSVDLNRLRETVLMNQNLGEATPENIENKVFVDKDGKIIQGSEKLSNKRNLSEVPQETFASRHTEERRVVKKYLPENTLEIETNEGVKGWVYGFVNDFNQTFSMFAFYDGSYYQVLVLAPEIEAQWKSPHTGHLFSNGKICFGSNFNSGCKTLQDAFSKSVLWSNGISVALENGYFPFSVNQ